MTARPPSATSQIARLRGVSWEWREDAPAEARSEPGMGVIAQEVERVFPELVETDELGRKKVDYDGLFPPMFAAVRELVERVRALERRRAGATMDPRESDQGERVARAAEAATGTSLDPDALERVFPDLVSTDEHGDKVVAYHGLAAPLIEAIKELDARVSALEER